MNDLAFTFKTGFSKFVAEVIDRNAHKYQAFENKEL